MTITMVNPPHRAAARPPRLAVAMALLALAPASRAEWKFTPYVDVRETYTDNVALRPVAEANWVTDLTPSLQLEHTGPRLNLRASYSKHFFKYADDTVGGVQRQNQSLAAAGLAKVIDELLYVDATASISQQDRSAFGPLVQSTDNTFASNNATEVKSARISPYLKHRFGPYANAQLRYSYDRVTSSGVGLNNTSGSGYTLNVDSGTAFRLLGWNLLANKSTQKGVGTTTSDAESDSENVALNLRWMASSQLSLTAMRGYDSYDYQALGGSNGGASWQLGAEWQPSSRTHVQASAGRRYYGNSYSLQAQYRARASVWSINYNDAVTSTRQQFLLPSSVDTFAMLDRLFASAIEDPAARRQAVEAYMLAAGLPPSLSNSINYFSNRYFLQKQFQAAVAMNGPHTTTVLSVQDTRRNGLSSAVVDNNLLGTTTTTLNDNTRQTGATASLSWRLSSRTGVVASADVSRVRSLSANLTALNRNVRVGLTRQLQPKLRATVDVRRVKGGMGAASYTENAVSATLNKQF